VTRRNDPIDEIRILRDPFADKEKRPATVVAPEYLQQISGMAGVWPVIEGQGHAVGGTPGTLDQKRGEQSSFQHALQHDFIPAAPATAGGTRTDSYARPDESRVKYSILSPNCSAGCIT